MPVTSRHPLESPPVRFSALHSRLQQHGSHRRSKRRSGFTLIELLTYTVLSALVLSATVSVVVSTNRYNNRMLRSMRLQDRWARLSQLIESEVAEGKQITYGVSLPAACGSFPGTPNPIVNVTIPYLASGTSAATTDTSIIYFLSNGNLYRCGPPFKEDGRLDLGQPLVASLLTSGTSFSVDTSTTSSDPSRVLRYTLQYSTTEYPYSEDKQPVVLLTRSASARTRVSPTP